MRPRLFIVGGRDYAEDEGARPFLDEVTVARIT